MASPPWIILSLVIVSSMLFPSFNSKLLRGNETDRLSLLALKSVITHDPFGVLSSWNDSLHFCDWFGVTCGHRHRRVTVLDLSSSRLAGSLSPHVGNLSFMKTLNLSNNSFGHSMPRELGRLYRLEILRLENNSFSGEIPVNVSRCSNLRILRIAHNSLTGALPAELGMLRKLEVLSFHMNVISGEIPTSLGNLSSLNVISGIQNSLVGTIPESFGRLTELTFLVLEENNLRGKLPRSLYNLSSLNVFSVSVNRLEGALPLDLGLLFPSIEILGLAQNGFSGKIPSTLSNASKLSEINFSFNNFSGKMPSLAGLNDLTWVLFSGNHLGYKEDDDLNFLLDLVNCSQLRAIEITKNNFGGMLPNNIGNFSMRLRKIQFSVNWIRGPIPSGLRNLVGLEILELAINQISGTIPSFLGALPNLNYLLLAFNGFSGSIPSSLGNISSLLKLDLRANSLQGNIPASLGNLQNLLYMDFAGNKLSGAIPREIMRIGSLSTGLHLSSNQLTGPIPLEIGKLETLGVLDFSSNRLQGEIPGTLGGCISLETLFLDGNLLHGKIPQSLRSLRAIERVDFSCNNLSGIIPEFFGGFKLLREMNLSFNDFEGKVPTQGVFKNASAVSLTGNKKLCGGISQLKLPRCTSNGSKKDKSSEKSRIVIAVTLGIVVPGLILLFMLLVFYWSRKPRNAAISTPSFRKYFPRITYGELFKATDGFSSGNLVGMGGFGSVYKGVLYLDETETIVAVKVLNLHQKGALKSFNTECEALRSIRHRNLVKTLTVCSGTDFQGNDFKALVYEFMVNGSLEEWLHPAEMESPSQDNPQFLGLTQRMNVAIDVANAMDYLHNQCSQPIVHRDLKPSNVLLNDDMTGCIGDFGLARLLPEAFIHLSAGQTSSAGVIGSIGYAAPEYASGSEASTYGDIYSYGILLLEIFTRKRPTDEMFKDGLNLHTFVEAALPEQLLKIVDPVLLQETEVSTTLNNKKHDQILAECLISVLEIGLACSAERPRDRMNIMDATAQLCSIIEKLLRLRGRQRS